MDFLNRHLSVTAKTMVKCAEDFDEASSKLIKVYGNSWAIIRRALMEADDEITPVWRRVQACNDRIKPNRSAPLINVGDNILVMETLLFLFKRLKDMSERDEKFKVNIFNSQVIEPILGLVPKKVRFRFIRECVKNKFNLRSMDENYFMEFENFIHNEHRVALNAASLLSATDAELKNVVK